MGETTEKKQPDKNLILCCGIFAVYALLTFIGAANHELWFDEAQAWNIARDNDIAGIFHQISYEGHPPLWYLILYIPSHLGLSCEVLPYISWFITGLAGALVMFKAPFGIITRSALLFSGGFLFLNSTISRVYCIINLAIVLIAILYPKRKKYPVLYGLLIALLANTHVMMCGFIGILGIFMIIDFFRDCKTAGVKQNIKELCGLAIAGIGVLMLVLPLLHSVSLNSTTSQKEFTLGTVAGSFASSLTNISLTLITYGHGTGVLTFVDLIHYVFAFLTALAFILMIVAMRHKTRPFLMLLFFFVFYIITSEVIWVTIPNRALIFAAMFLIIAWIAEYEPQNNAIKLWDKGEPKTDTKLIKKLLEWAKRLDKGYRKTYIALITVVLIFSVPAGAIYLFRDYTEPFCPSKLAAEYISEELPEDSVLICDGETVPQITAYLPDYKFYALDYGRFYTYCTHERLEEEADYAEIYGDLKDCEHLYYIYVQNYSSDHEDINIPEKVVKIIRGGMTYGVNLDYVLIEKFDLETDLTEYIESREEREN